MQESSKIVASAQQGPHTGLARLLQRRQGRHFTKDIAPHSRAAFAQLLESLDSHGGRLILDSGCGTGESSRQLAVRFPDHVVLGIDKSAHRLSLGEYALQIVRQGNLVLLRAELIDFWRLACCEGWHLDRHYLFYPNPWPKPAHLQRRWHGHPVFGDLLKLGGQLELRSNWEIYVEEFAQALEIVAGVTATIETIAPIDFVSPFERKYSLSGHTLYRLNVDLSLDD